MEIVGIDGLAYEPDRLNTFVGFRRSGIGEHRFGGVDFIACSWCRVFRFSSAPKADCRLRQPFVFRFSVLPRLIRAVAVVSQPCCGIGLLLPSPEGPPDAAAQSSGNPFNPRPGEGTGADPIVVDGIVDAPFVFDVAVHLYWWGSGTDAMTTLPSWWSHIDETEFEMLVYHFPDNGGDTHRITYDYKWNNSNPEDKDILSHAFERYGVPGSSFECVIYRDATEPAHFIDGRDQANSLVHLYAGNSKAVIYPSDAAWPCYVPVCYYSLGSLWDGYSTP